MASFRDLEQKWCAKVGALLELQWWGRRKEKATWGREGEKLLKFFGLSEERERGLCLKGFLFFFFFFKKSCATCLLLSGAKRGSLFLLMWLILSHKKRKIWPFEALKSCLGLHVVSLVLVPCISLHLSGPVSESKQYVYQNAQNETPSVVHRLVSLNFKLHAK